MKKFLLIRLTRRSLYMVGGVVLVCMLAGGCRQISGSYFSNDHGSGAMTDLDAQNPAVSTSRITAPAVFIPGLFGSELRDDCNRTVWGRFAYADMADGTFFRRLALNVDTDANAANTLIHPGNLLFESEIPLFFGDSQINNYRFIIDLLHRSGYADCNGNIAENTLFIFYYDWRLSIAENAAQLADFLEKKKRLYAEKGVNDIRFDLIGHSMGGLIARYYVQFGSVLPEQLDLAAAIPWSGAENVRKVIQIATPNRGYADTLFEMANGLYLMRLAPVFPGSVLATFPSYYQMLPATDLPALQINGQMRNILDWELFRHLKLGLLDGSAATAQLLEELMPQRNETQRLHLAELYTRKMIEHAIAYKKLLARKMLNKPAHLDFYLLASGNIPTPAYLKIDGKNGGITCVGYAAGDGKVALQSALDPAVDFRSVYVLEGGHMGLMRSCLFAWNLLQILGS